MKTIILQAARTQAQVENGQCDIEETHDTVADAKRRARYVLTPEYARMGEMSERLGYARVLVNGECRHDFFKP